jgi:ADP-heptose:LPS heptosyltransferase
MRLVNILKTHGLKGEIIYPIKKIIPIDKTLIDLLNNELIAFIIGSKLMKKKWSLDNWVTLSNLISNKNKIIIIGGETELDEAEYIHLKTSNTYNFCNKLSISELFYVFQNISLAVSHDTGAMHVCDAVGTKTIGLFSSKELTTKWYPNTKNSVVIENDISMANISADKVYEEVKKLGIKF